MPYEMDYSLIGTTEIPFDGDPSKARISADEIIYLCAAVSRYFRKPLSPGDVVESFSGVRPLYDDGAAALPPLTRALCSRSRRAVGQCAAPFGFRRQDHHLPALGGGCHGEAFAISEAAARERWTATAPLPGGDMEGGDFDRFLRTLRGKYPWLDAATATRLARAYGTRAGLILGNAEVLTISGSILARGSFKPRSII